MKKTGAVLDSSAHGHRRSSPRPPSLAILNYHNIEGSWCFPSRPGSGPNAFAKQLKVLRRITNVVPLAAALDDLAEGQPLPPRATAITFDDGYRDVLQHAVPLLERFRLPATFFLVPGLLSRQVRPWWEVIGWACATTRRQTVSWQGREMSLESPTARRRAALFAAEHVKRKSRVQLEAAVDDLLGRLEVEGRREEVDLFMNWDEARELKARGFSIGSHTLTHPILAREAQVEQQHELRESRRQLESRLGAAVTLLAYPNGTVNDYTPTTIECSKASGYVNAFTTIPRLNRPLTPAFELRRYVVSPSLGLREWVPLLRSILTTGGPKASLSSESDL